MFTLVGEPGYHSANDEPEYHSAWTRVRDHYIVADHKTHRYASWSTELKDKDFTIPTYSNRLYEAAELMCASHRLFWASLFQQFGRLQADGFLRIEMVSLVVQADETPSKMRLRDRGPAKGSNVSTLAIAGPARLDSYSMGKASRQVVKVQQCELVITVLIQILRGHQQGRPKFYHYSGELPVPLSSFDHVTADNLIAWYRDMLSLGDSKGTMLWADVPVERVVAVTTMDLAS